MATLPVGFVEEAKPPEGLGLKGKGNIHRIIHRLQDDGHLTVTPHKFRSVKIRDKSVRDVASL